MQRGYRLLIAGAAILAVGIILIGITFVILKQQSFSINSSIETVSPGKSMFKTYEVRAGKKMAIVVNYQPTATTNNNIQYPCPIVNRFECPYEKDKQVSKNKDTDFDVNDLFELEKMAFAVEVAFAKTEDHASKIHSFKK